MEIRLTGGQIRRVQTTGETKSETGQTAKSASTGGRTATAQTDRLSLSKQAAAFLLEQTRAAQEQAARAAKENAQEDGNGMVDLMNKALKTMKQCLEIARRIRAGDKVPPEDEEFLMNNDPAGYKLAMAMRVVKKDPKEWESVLDDEDKESGGVEETSESSEDTGSVSETAASGGSDGGGTTAG